MVCAEDCSMNIVADRLSDKLQAENRLHREALKEVKRLRFYLCALYAFNICWIVL